MTTETLAPFDPLAEAIAAVDGWPEVADPAERRHPPAPEGDGQAAARTS